LSSTGRQEALSNAARHSGGADRRQPQELDTGVELKVSDNGRGFSFADADQGLGIAGMRERALLVDGEVEIHSRPGEGTTVWLRIDTPAEETVAASSS
jgi:signal transduction histidine kinase